MATDRRTFVASLLAMAAAGRLAAARAGDRDADGRARVVVGYLASWKAGAKGLRIADIPAGALTHLCYAFGGLGEDGRVRLADPCMDAGDCGAGGGRGPAGNFAELAKLKEANPHLRLSIAIGGWTGSRHFSDAAADGSARERFATSVMDVFFRPYSGLFDGVDLDWEYPVKGGLDGNVARPQDRENLTALVAGLRRALDDGRDGQGRRRELTIAVSGDPSKIANIEASALAAHVDRFNLMTYDYYAGSGVAGFNAPLFACIEGERREHCGSVDASVMALRRAGVPAERIALGLPFYGRATATGSGADDGLFQRAVPAGAADWGGENGIDYRDLVARQPEQAGFRRRWNEEAAVPWLYHPERKVFISYDDPRSIGRKADYARRKGLAGVMIWDIFADDGTLLEAVRAALPRG